jgi:hypothetical protein
MAYAVFTGDPHYHLVASVTECKTLCDLSTGGSIKNVRELRFAGRITLDEPPLLSLHTKCLLRIAARAQLNR